jgi:hypothetical protein
MIKELSGPSGLVKELLKLPRRFMQNSIRLVIVLVAVAGAALAVPAGHAPELDGGSAASALGLLAGAALMIRTKR